MPPVFSAVFSAVIFDLDGTLIDTETLCNETGVEACANLGHPVDLAFFEGLAGIDDVNRMRLIGEHTGHPVDPQAFLAEWDRLCDLRYPTDIALKPGVPQVLHRIADLGLPLALCTSSRRGPAMTKIRAAGLDACFQAIVTFDDVANPKPDPEPYRIAAARLGVAPTSCLAFEDSDTGTASARAAGLCVVQVPDLHPPRQHHAHFVASTILQGAAMAGLALD